MDFENFGLPTGSDVFEEIAKSEQHIKVTTDKRRYGKIITLVSGLARTWNLRR